MTKLTKYSIHFYQIFISPVFRLLFGTGCRYSPTCSEYAKQATAAHGLTKGSYFALKRISSCHPLGGSGYDPVPTK